MPYTSDIMPINNEKLDRRVKLTHEQKEEIVKLFKKHAANAKKGILQEAISQRIIAKRYGVSRRTIIWILHPDRLVENRKRREERGGWKQYYNKNKNTLTMREHRAYKQKLYKQGLLKRKEVEK